MQRYLIVAGTTGLMVEVRTIVLIEYNYSRAHPQHKGKKYEGELTRVFQAIIREYGPDRQQLSKRLVASINLKLLLFDGDEDRVVRVGHYRNQLIFPLGWDNCTIKRLTLFKKNAEVFVI